MQRRNISLRIKFFNAELIKCFQKQLSPDGKHEDISKIKDSYVLHHYHSEAHTSLFIEHLKHTGANTQTIEHIIDEIMKLEIQFHGGKEIKAIECLMKNMKDPILKNWLIGLLDRGFFYKLQNIFWNSLSWNLKSLIELSFSIVLGIVTIVLFYFDLYKDVVFFSILDHIWTEILVRNIFIIYIFKIMFSNRLDIYKNKYIFSEL